MEKFKTQIGKIFLQEQTQELKGLNIFICAENQRVTKGTTMLHKPKNSTT